MSQTYRCPHAFLHRGSGGIAPGRATPPGAAGDISSRAAPFPMNGKGRGDRVERAVKSLIFHGWTVYAIFHEKILHKKYNVSQTSHMDFSYAP